MTDAKLTPADLEALRAFDTPTICNALEIVAPERRGMGYTVEPLECPFPDLPPIVGYARTASIRAMLPTARSGQEMKAQRMAYYEYVAGGQGPTVSVIQDLDGGRKGYGAFWGEVQSNIHNGLGCLGVVTDGSVRDIPDWSEGFQALAGRIGPSHAHVHLQNFGETVNVAGMVVSSGDIIHADRHGAVVVPASVVKKIPVAVDLLVRREAVILEACRKPGFDIEALRRAMAGADEIH